MTERKRITPEMEFEAGMVLKHTHDGSLMLVGSITRYSGLRLPGLGEEIKGHSVMFFGYFYWRWCTPEDLTTLLPDTTP